VKIVYSYFKNYYYQADEKRARIFLQIKFKIIKIAVCKRLVINESRINKIGLNEKPNPDELPC
jgi:hypothetical protein